MKKNTIIYIGIAVIILIIGIIVFSRQTTVDNNQNDGNLNVNQETFAPLEIMTVNHQYLDGTHTIVGTLSLPTPCHSYNATTNTVGDTTEVYLEILEPSNDSDTVCAQVITDVTFRVEFEAPENQKISGFLNGKAVILNLFSIPEGENIDDYEMMIKG